MELILPDDECINGIKVIFSVLPLSINEWKMGKKTLLLELEYKQ